MSTQNQAVDVSTEQLKLEIERLRSENEALRASRNNSGGLRVSNKGALSVYGIGSLPVTLYKEQWLRVLDREQQIRDFIKAHDSLLKSKPEDFVSMREEAEAQGLSSLAPLMVQRQAENLKDLSNRANRVVSDNQAPLPGMAATPVVQKKRR